MFRNGRLWLGVGVLTGFAVLTTLSASPAAHNETTVVMKGLENPRGLAIGPEGALYVVEAGKGGPEGPSNCQVLRGLKRCFGTTGALTRVWRGKQERVATRLPSVSDLTANPEVGGPQDVSFFGRGGTFITIGLGGDPTTVRPGYGPGAEALGTLGNRWHRVRRIETTAGMMTMARSGSGAFSLDAPVRGVSLQTFQRTKLRKTPPADRSIPIRTGCSLRPALASSLTPEPTRFFASRPTVTSRRSPYCRAPSVGQRGRSTRCQRRSSWDLMAPTTSGC